MNAGIGENRDGRLRNRRQTAQRSIIDITSFHSAFLPTRNISNNHLMWLVFDLTSIFILRKLTQQHDRLQQNRIPYSAELHSRADIQASYCSSCLSPNRMDFIQPRHCAKKIASGHHYSKSSGNDSVQSVINRALHQAEYQSPGPLLRAHRKAPGLHQPHQQRRRFARAP